MVLKASSQSFHFPMCLPGPTWMGCPSRRGMRAATRDVLSGGLWAGLIGYGSVAVVIAVLNVLAGR